MEPVNASARGCSDNVQYKVSYSCCSDTNWNETRYTINTSIEFQLNEEECENESLVVFSVQVEGVNSSRANYLKVNLTDSTGTNICLRITRQMYTLIG